MDITLPENEITEVKSILDSYKTQGVNYHALRSRQAAARKFLVVHLLVPGDWTVRQGHKVAEEIETQVIKAIPHSNIATHIEPIEDPISQQDVAIDRGSS
jgi:divalent metal cation (Fe/Co/Zn/Cd) transporter